MTDRQLIEQFLNRSITNAIRSINPQLSMLSPTVTKYAMQLLDPYITAFTDSADGRINTQAAETYLKEEASKRISELMN